MKGGVATTLFLFWVLLCRAINGETDASAATASLIDRHEAQLARLESLLESLSQSVSRLESAVAAPSSPPNPSPAAVPVTKFKPSWPEKFQIAAAAQLGSAVTAATALPRDDDDAHGKFFAVAAGAGAVFVFSAAGDLLAEIPPPSPPADVTAMLASASPLRNETLLFTGHGDGSVFAHSIGAAVAVVAGSRAVFVGDGSDPILSLGIFAMGRARFVAAADGGGKVRIFSDSGALRGIAAVAGRPLAFSRHRPLFLTETGAGSLDLRSMTVKETVCEGLNATRAIAYAFDVTERSKAYGITAAGDLVQVSLLGDAASIKCRVRAARKIEISGYAATLETIRGYLIAADAEKIFVYNVSSGHYGRAAPPRLLFSSSFEEIGAGKAVGRPVIAGDREKALLLGSGNGFVGIYRSSLPVYKAESGSVLWSSPVLVFLVFLVGIWHFYAKKKDVLGWTPEEEMESPEFAATIGGGEAAVIGGPARRFVSPPPPRYGDGGFISSGEIKYRAAAQRMETATGFVKRRDAIVDDHID
ncbi:putative membrane protein At1g75140 [Wolffia australiana]